VAAPDDEKDANASAAVADDATVTVAVADDPRSGLEPKPHLVAVPWDLHEYKDTEEGN